MNKKKLIDSLLVALMLSLSFAFTSCEDDDKDSGSSSSSPLAHTSWYGEDNSGNEYSVDFHEDEIDLYNYSTGGGCYADYSISGDKIKFSNVDRNGYLKSGSFSYKISGRKGNREMTIYDALRGGDDLYLEEATDDEPLGSDDDWDFDW